MQIYDRNSPTWEDLEKMGYSALSDMCEDDDITVDPESYNKKLIKQFRLAVAEDLSIEVPNKLLKKADKKSAGKGSGKLMKQLKAETKILKSTISKVFDIVESL